MRPGSLVAVAISGQGVGWLLTLLLARELGVEGFEAYVVASAVFVLLASLAPLGAEKYALRLLPGLLARGELGAARGYLGFGVRRTLLTAMACAAGVALWLLLAGQAGPVRSAVLVTCLSLPAGALAHFGVEVLSAVGRPGRALLLFRLLVPAVALGLALALLPFGLTGAMAVGCWGIGWMLALGLMWRSFRRAAPGGLRAAEPEPADARWPTATRPFLVHRLAMAVLAQAGVIALPLLGADGISVGAYAAAMGTVGLAGVLATATNRAYGRQLSLLLEAADYKAVMAARQARLKWMLPAVALFLLLVFGLSRDLLALFRPEFADVGVLPLRLLAISTAFSVLFSLAPTTLKYLGESNSLYRIVAAAAGVQMLLLLVLVPGLGATGAAIAYLVSMAGGYGAFAWAAWRRINS